MTMAGTGKLSEQVYVVGYPVTAEGPSDVGWINAEEVTAFMAYLTKCSEASSPETGYDDFRILGNPQANGGGTDVVLQATHAEDGDADAIGDQLMQEVTEADLANYAENPIKGLSASVGTVTAAEVSCCTYIVRKRKQQADLTPASVIA